MKDTTTFPQLLRLPATVAAQAPFISILLPVRNEAAFIGETLERLLGQDYDPQRFEVLVADGRYTDRTREIVAAFQEWHPHVILLDNPRQWSSTGRNIALAASRGDLVVVVDGHCELDNPQYLADLADAFQRSDADCVGRPQPLNVSGATLLQQAIAAARSSRLGHHPDSPIYADHEGFVPPQSVAVAYRRSVFNKVGLFDEEFDACEDVEFNHRVARAGLRCFFTPRVRVRYFPRGSLRGLLRQMVRYGRGRVRLSRKHPETFTAAGFVPAAFLAGVAVGPALAWSSPLLGWLYGGVLGAYALLLVFFSVAISRKERAPRMLSLLPLVFLTIHAGAGWGILWEMLRGRRPARQTNPAISGEAMSGREAA